MAVSRHQMAKNRHVMAIFCHLIAVFRHVMATFCDLIAVFRHHVAIFRHLIAVCRDRMGGFCKSHGDLIAPSCRSAFMSMVLPSGGRNVSHHGVAVVAVGEKSLAEAVDRWAP